LVAFDARDRAALLSALARGQIQAIVLAIHPAVFVAVFIGATAVLRPTRLIRAFIGLGDHAVVIRIDAVALLQPVDLLLLDRVLRLPRDAVEDAERGRAEAASRAEAAADRDSDPLPRLPADPEQHLRGHLLGAVREARERRITIDLADHRDAPALND